MNFFSTPHWINGELLQYKRLEDIPQSIFDGINQRLKKLTSDEPVVSVVIPAWNEEVNIVRTIDSLSRNITSFKTEIVVVNNNSTDKTQEALDKLQVRNFFQPVAGCGPSRQLGQEHARGKYILMADADCFYPQDWIEILTRALHQDGVACVYGRYSFVGNDKQPRWKFSIYESLRDVVAEVRHFNRPHMNALGMNMGYVRELGLKAGFIQRAMRGEDGRMCFKLRQMGKVVQIRSSRARVWTLPRTLQKDGNLLQAFTVRAVLEISRIHHYFFPLKPHDVNTSENYDPGVVKLLKKQIKKKKQTPQEQV
jgi:glycosyltransferase involved in cell wall biosynthesis